MKTIDDHSMIMFDLIDLYPYLEIKLFKISSLKEFENILFPDHRAELNIRV